ncbi:MAG: beta strand repeat-containing protein, partial [Planctomycetia bacterium]
MTGSDNASIWIQASPNTVTLSTSIVTAGGAITIDDGAGGNTSVVLGASTVLDTTNGGAVPTGGAVTIRGTVTSDPLSSASFQVRAGTDGDVRITDTIGDVGAGVALASLWITGNDISLGAIDGVVGNSSVEATDGTDTGSVTLTGQTYATSGGLNLSAGPRNPSNVVFNPLTLTGGVAGSTSMISTGGNLVELSGAINLNGRNLTIDTTAGGSVTAGGPVLINDSIDGAGTLVIDAGTAGVVSVNHLSGAVGGMTPLTAVTLTNAHTAEFGRNVSAGTVTITDATTSVRFGGVVTLATGLVTAAQPYDLVFLGGNRGVNSIAGATTFLNTGSLQLGDTGSDTFTFAGGVVATAPSGVSLGSTVAATTGVITLGDSNTTVTISAAAAIGGASTGAISLGPVILANGAAMTVGTGIANAIQLGSISGTADGAGSDVTVDTTGAVTVTGAVGTDVSGLTITNSGGTTFQSTVDADLVTITDTTGTVTFQNALTATGLTTATKGYAVALLGDGSAITSVTTFGNTGGVMLGNGGDTITFNGGITSTASTTTINGTVATSGDAAVFGGVTLGGNSIIDATGGIETQAITGDGFDLQLISGDSDANILGAATGLDTVTLMASSPATGLVWFRNSLVATEIVTFAQAYRVRLAESGTTTITNATHFLNTGTLQIGNSGTLATFTGGLMATAGPSSITLAGTITTVNSALALGAVTLADDTTLAGTTITTAAAVTGSDKALAITGNASVGGAISGVTTYSVSGTTSLGAGVAASGTQAYTGLVTLTANATLSGTPPTFTAGVAGAGHDLAIDFSGTTVLTGAAFTGIRNLSAGNGGDTTLSGTLTTTGNQTFHDDVTLAANSTLDAGTGSILLAGVVSGGFALTPLTSGSGTTTLSGANT